MKTRATRATRATVLCWALAALAGCAGMGSHDMAYREPVYPAAAADEAIIYVYRELGMFGAALSWDILVDGESVGTVYQGTYLWRRVPPGEHTVRVRHNSHVSERTINAEAGRDYYIQQHVKMGFWSGFPLLTIVDPAEGRQAVRELRYLEVAGEVKAWD